MAKQEIILGGGCFWCLEAVYELLDGVEDVVSGYANGQTENPDYRSVCSGETGHAEVIKITYNDKVITTDDLLEIFFDIHDPTTLNRQGADVGTQYRSVILYESEDVKEKAFKARDEAQMKYDAPIMTIIEPLNKFYLAESYHQDYYRQNMMQGYCMAVISPKVLKLREKFGEKVKS
ncbi:MAG: peptide-methionine (S)-S-oxide reductase MsrA [Campylobacterota bacterium]|nr:peptide-methionine (S)-S-oxide reductase MsrA [Campylobacterota bacterium]